MSWKQAKLSDIADVQVGFAFPSKDFLDADKAGIFLLRGDNLQQGYIRWGDKTKKWTDIEDKKLERYFLQKHDVVLAMDRPIVSGGLKISKILDQDLPSYLVQRVMRLRGLCDVDTSYIFHLLRSNNFIGYIERITTGANIPHISHKEVVEYTFQLPPISIRKKIALILSNYDDLIQTNQQRIALLEEAAQRLYDEWFVKLRFPNHEQVPVVDGVPEGWERGIVGDLASINSGFAFKGSDWLDKGNPVIKIRNITTDYQVELTNCDCIDDNIAQTASRFEVFAGDLLIAMTGATVGKVGIFPPVDKRYYLNQRVGKFFPKNEASHIIFLFFFSMTDFFQNCINNLAGGSAQPNISGGQIESIPLLVASKEVMTSFMQIVKPLFEQRQLLTAQNQKLAHARDGLLPRLMSGKMDVSGLNPQEIA